MINPASPDYFKTLDKVGGPTDPMDGIEEVILFLFEEKDKYQNYEDHPLVPILKKYSYEETPGRPLDDDKKEEE
jgi:mRNA-degrading endonuclease YafQ of YafQ-DinJ toxin-antitoxin module